MLYHILRPPPRRQIEQLGRLFNRIPVAVARHIVLTAMFPIERDGHEELVAELLARALMAGFAPLRALR